MKLKDLLNDSSTETDVTQKRESSDSCWQDAFAAAPREQPNYSPGLWGLGFCVSPLHGSNSNSYDMSNNRNRNNSSNNQDDISCNTCCSTTTTAPSPVDISSLLPRVPPLHHQLPKSEARAVLRSIFEHVKFPNADQKDLIAARLGWTSKSVHVWFQNRRHSYKQEMRRHGFLVPSGRGKRGDLNQIAYERAFRKHSA